MAKASFEIIHLLRSVSQTLNERSDYQWGHMGSCNCGFLAQAITHRSKQEIHSAAMMGSGDWNEQLNDYCPSSGRLMDALISELLDFGFDSDDLKHLERLSNPKVRAFLPSENRHLVHNNKSDVITYLRAWADLLEAELIDGLKVDLPVDDLQAAETCTPGSL